MPTAPATIPPKPNMAAIIAITRNVTVQRNIVFVFKDEEIFINLKNHASDFFISSPMGLRLLIIRTRKKKI